MGAKWILLEPGVDTIQAGDEWWNSPSGEWRLFTTVSKCGFVGEILNVESVPCRRRVVDPVCTREAYGSGGAPSPRECGICGVGPCSKADTVSSIAESPDDWVTQDRVPARPGIDQRAYTTGAKDIPSEGSWDDAGKISWPKMPMHSYGSNGTFVHLRCRRKDLPPMPAKTRTVTLREWICWDYGHEDALIIRWSSGDPSKRSGNLSVFDHAHATGNTRTVEVPCE